MRRKIQQLLYVLFCSVLPLGETNAQAIVSRDYFRLPVEGKPFITGTFGEFRSDHLHSGIDYSTDKKTGKNIYAVADGYVSRIKVSPYGYGKALYLTHPNGLVSVYAHLEEFCPPVQEFVLRKQYENETFEIELFPDSNLFKLRKGDIVGYSGNTGSSTGPHLHFEIRNKNTERPINPVMYGMIEKDSLFPVIEELKIFPLGNGSKINDKEIPVSFKPEKNKNSHRYLLKDTVKIYGSCYFGIAAFDYVSGKNSAGIYSAKFFVDSLLYFDFSMDSFAFSQSRFVNDMLDYAGYVENQKRIIVFRKSAINDLPIYRNAINRGILSFEKPQIHRIIIQIADYHGNSAEMQFWVSGKPALINSAAVNEKKQRLFEPGIINRFENPEIKIEFPAGSLYEPVYFDYSVSGTSPAPYSALHSVLNKKVPLHKPVLLEIKADKVPPELLSKAFIARYVSENKFQYLGGEIANGFLKTKTSKLGDFFIAVDTVKPQIKPVNFKNGHHIGDIEKLMVRLKDEFSGIDKYRAEINGRWVLAEYDAKNDLLIIPLNDRNIPEADFNLMICVTDKVRNESKMLFRIKR